MTLTNLTTYTTADEHFWLPNLGEERILDYWRELLKGDFEDTRINDKPGITLAYLSGIAIPFTQHLYDSQRTNVSDKEVQYDPEITKIMHFSYRFPIVFFIGCFSWYFFWILKRITKSEHTAGLSVVLILLSPVLLGISMIVNPDTLFWVFGSATFLTFIAYAQDRRASYTWLTTLFFGLALASKYVAVLFFPMFLLILGLSYLFFSHQLIHDKITLKSIILADVRRYYGIIIGGIALFALMMPAAIVDPQVLYESTIGFPGMLPLFLATIVTTLLILIDAWIFSSRGVSWLIKNIQPYCSILERVVYAILILFSLFVLFNWMSKNSLIDLSHIPFYAKTKDSFTEDNVYLVRYVMEFVPLIFALTPITLFLLLFFWIKAFFLESSQRFLSLILSLFILIFYAAVVEQGLLVTVRYSIILFPLVMILVSLGFIDTLRSDRKEKEPHVYIAALITIGVIALSFAALFLVEFHNNSPLVIRQRTEHIIGVYGIPIILAGLAILLMLRPWFIERMRVILSTFRLHSFTFPVCMTLIIIISLSSLFSAKPHFFLYMNNLLPERYVLNLAWGYGGYEAAQYLNALPNAENLTLWADSHGVCEFFVGKCIRSQKLDIREYRVDYIFETHRGALAKKFETESEKVWDYYPDGRDTNYVRIRKNDPESALKELEIKERLEQQNPETASQEK